MILSRRRAMRRACALVAAAGLLALGPVRSLQAIEAVADPLQGPFVDVGLVEAPNLNGSASIPPRLLAVRTADPTAPGSIELEMLSLDGPAWTVTTRTTITTGLADSGPASLVPLNGKFALVASDAAARQTFVALIEPGPTSIRHKVARFANVGQTATGVADIDGDGSDELVLLGDAVPDGAGGCDGSWLNVMSGDGLLDRVTVFLPGVGFDGGAIGRFGPGGEDLIAYVHHSCQTGVAPSPTDVELVDLKTGDHRALERPGDIPFGSERGPVLPLVADLDGDGVDEPILRADNAVVVLDPAKAWRSETVETDAIPLAVIDRTDRPRLVVQEPGVRQAQVRIRLLALGRVGRDGEVIQRGVTGVIAPVPGAGSPRLQANDLATEPAAPASSWAGDLDGTGCRTLLVSAATFGQCPADPRAWSARHGPAWLQTVPLVAYGEPGARRLLVAAGTGWATARPGLAIPGPAASLTARTAGWRSGPSAPFALVVVDPQALSETGAIPAPAIRVDPNVVDRDAPRMLIDGRVGDRIFARLGPILGPDPGVAGPLPSAGVGSGSGDVGDFLLARPSEGFGSVAFIPVPESSRAGQDGGAASFSMPVMEALALPATPPTTWAVTVLGLNVFGEPSPYLTGRVELDVVGPSVTLEAPLLSPLWPVTASIRGRTEPGARVRVGAGAFVDVARDGSFELPAELAPWPQDLTIAALDARGNPSISTVSVVGGFDYRQLPWQALVIGAVLLVAGITSLRGPSIRRRSTRIGPALVAPADGQPLPTAFGQPPPAVEGDAEIEDLPSPPRRTSPD